MNSQRVIALLGRKDEPTDAVEDYCRYLGAALTAHNVQLDIQRVPWEEIGWPPALAQLEKSAASWRGEWVFVQYTALAWSARGFPSRFQSVLKILRAAGARVAIVFHDVQAFAGSRMVDRLRRAIQFRAMRRAVSVVDSSIFTVPIEKLSWLPEARGKAIFIPVGANLPIPAGQLPARTGAVLTIGVFSITGGEVGANETRIILGAANHASTKLGRLRLSVFGRHAELREAALRRGLQNLPVELSVEGVIEPEQIVQRLSACDVLLFVRGPISSRRGSAIAGIACGLPIIAFSGTETAAPITDAGVMLVPDNQPEQLNDALVRILSNADLRAELAARSQAAYQAHFSWDSIATSFANFLKTRLKK
jgi:glycosyltransferase involved in cell wall biosynthesis